MVDSTLHPEDRLRVLLARFTDCRASWRKPICEMLEKLHHHDWGTVLFGGTIRDLMIGGLSAEPRDIDLVVRGVEVQQLEHVFGQQLKRLTRFGGVHLEFKGWLFDVWPLHETWAFRTGAFPATFEELPKTTFLNIEAIAAELFPRRGKKRQVYSHGFFEAYESRILDINFEENPFPSLCVVRALITAAKLGFGMGIRLAKYVSVYGTRVTLEELISIQRAHYGIVRCHAQELDMWLRHVDTEVKRGTSNSIRLPVTRERQMLLWDWVPQPPNGVCLSARNDARRTRQRPALQRRTMQRLQREFWT